MHFDSPTMQTLFYILAALTAAILLFIGFRLGRFTASFTHRRAIAQREQELFTAQKGFKNLYEHETSNLKSDNDLLRAEIDELNQKLEDYRKKAAGFGSLFTPGRHKEAMYALLLENEELQDALHIQNDKLRQERADAIKAQLRATGHRRTLISQLLSERRVKDYIAEVQANNHPDNATSSLSNTTPSALVKPTNPDQRV